MVMISSLFLIFLRVVLLMVVALQIVFESLLDAWLKLQCCWWNELMLDIFVDVHQLVPGEPVRLGEALLKFGHHRLRLVIFPLLYLIEVTTRVDHRKDEGVEFEDYLGELIVNFLDKVLSLKTLLLQSVIRSFRLQKLSALVLFHASQSLVYLIKGP